MAIQIILMLFRRGCRYPLEQYGASALADHGVRLYGK